MKLLILTDGITPLVIGGMQKHSFNLAKELATLGHEICLFHCVTGNNKLPEREDLEKLFGAAAWENIESICLRFPQPSWYPGHYLKESYLFSRMMYKRIEARLNEFDFIYAKGFAAWYFLEQKKRGKKMPPIGVKFHGYEMFQRGANLRTRFESFLLAKPVKWNNRHADVVFSYGGKITPLIASLGVESRKIIEIPTGIDKRWVSVRTGSSTDDKKHFCFIGRYERRKGIEELHAALKQLNRPDFHFHFIGPIPTSGQLKQANVSYHGTLRSTEEIQSVLDRCQVLVTPSYSEGMPNVIMEAMARGLAIIATPVGAVEAIVDNQNGWLVPPGDIDALRQCMETVIELPPSDLKKKQQASLDRVEHFTWNRIAQLTAEQIVHYLGEHYIRPL